MLFVLELVLTVARQRKAGKPGLRQIILVLVQVVDQQLIVEEDHVAFFIKLALERVSEPILDLRDYAEHEVGLATDVLVFGLGRLQEHQFGFDLLSRENLDRPLTMLKASKARGNVSSKRRR